MQRRRVSTLLLRIWCFQCVTGASSVFDFLFGGPCSGAESQEEELECKVNLVYEKAGIAQHTGLAKSNAIEQGKRALGCVASIGGIDMDRKLALLGPFDFLRNMVFEQYYSSMDDSRVESLCQAAQVRSNVLPVRRLTSDGLDDRDKMVQLQLSSELSKLRSHPERRLGTPASVRYPSSTSTSYTTWATQHLVDYLTNGDANSRADLDKVTEQLLDPIGTLQITIIDDGLAISEALVEVVCNIVGTVEFGFDPGDACRIISASIFLASVFNAVALQELEFELSRVTAHNMLIDQAEMEATQTDTAFLVTRLK